MVVNLLALPRFLALFMRIRLLNLISRFPPLAGGVLDEQSALLRKAQVMLGEIPLERISPVLARANMHDSFRTLKGVGGLFEEVDAIRQLSIPGPAGGIPARLYLPGKDATYPLFVLLHGGGWVIGDLDTADNMARFICKRADFAVLSVDYRLAPEHPFPAAVDDSFAAVCWAAEHAPELHGDANRIVVGGDSAGGSLSAVVSQLAHQRGAPRLAGQVLLYPSTDSSSLETLSYRELGEKSLGLTKRDVEWFLDQYVPRRQDRLDPLVSPLLAADVRGLAPALIVTAEYDVLRDEGEAYARRLEEAGVKVRLMRCNGMIHGFLSLIGLIKRATRYFDQIILEIRALAPAL
jgi:acetyl esterase